MKFKQIFQTQNLTTGIIWKKLIIFAIPIFISSLLGNAFSLVNSLVLKTTVGGDAVTAINVTGSISSLLFNFAYGCTSGFAVLISNKFGANDQLGIKKIYAHSLFISLIIGFFITILGIFLLHVLLDILNVADKFYSDAYNYFLIILIGFIFMVLSNLLGNLLRALGDSFFPLCVSLITTLLNIGLAFLFSGVIKLSTRGVAIATIASNLINVIITLIYLHKKHPYLNLKLKDFKLEKVETFDLLKMGIPLGLQWSILFIGSFIQSSQVNKFGVVLDSNNVETSMASKAATCYSSIEGYLTMPLSTMSSALLSFVGQNYGAKEYGRIKKGIKDTFLIDVVIAIICLIIGLPLIKYVPYIFLPENEVNESISYYCSMYLYAVIPSLILQGTLQLSRSTLQGIKKPLIPFLSGIGELCARAFVCFLFPVMINQANPLSDESYLGLCFSTPLAWLISVIIMGGSVIYFIFSKKSIFNYRNNSSSK